VLQDACKRGDRAEVTTIAHRTLAGDPYNFVALDALIWACLQAGDHAQAKLAVERAVASLEVLDTKHVYEGGVGNALNVLHWITSLPWFRRRMPTVPTAQEMAEGAARKRAEWKAWASAYLAWYESEYSGS
jgi:hypothetical protein